MANHCFVKDRKTFNTYVSCDCTEFELVLDSIYDNTSSATLIGEYIIDMGDYIIIDDFIGIIKSFESRNGMTTVVINDITTLFDKDWVYDPDKALGKTIEQFLADELNEKYVFQNDEKYRFPYLTVEAKTNNVDFVAPLQDDENSSLYNLYHYFAYVRRLRNVFVNITFSNDRLYLTITNRTPETKTIMFNSADVQMVSENQSSESIAKITVVLDYYTELDFYRFTDGSYSSDPSAGERAEGKWSVVTLESSDDYLGIVCSNEEMRAYGNVEDWPSESYGYGVYEFIFSGSSWSLDGTAVDLENFGITMYSYEPVEGDAITVYYDNDTFAEIQSKVEDEFARNSYSHSIEFYGNKKLGFYDNLRIQLKNQLLYSYVSQIIKKSNDNRYLYKSGEMRVTFTEKSLEVI